MTTGDRDYVLGTHDDEVLRLGLQHRVWRPRASDAWRRAGFTTGQTLLDVGCGPGFASVDLAEIVGSTGRVVAMDRSRRFLDVLDATCRARGLRNVTSHEMDLDHDPLPVTARAQGAWARWVFAFVQRPRDLLSRVVDALDDGAKLVLHEYVDYGTWRVMPRSIEMEEFVRIVMQSWRSSGGEPDIGLELPRWLEELGCSIESLTPIVDVVSPTSYQWQWPSTFMKTGLQRLIDLGHVDAARAHEIRAAFEAIDTTPGVRMVLPTVVEIIAVRGRSDGGNE